MVTEHTEHEITPEMSFAAPGTYTDQPQRLGLIDVEAIKNALRDPRSLVVQENGKQLPVLVPIEYATEANQDYFKDESAFFLDVYALAGLEEDHTDELANAIANLPLGSKIMLEVIENDDEIITSFTETAMLAGRVLTIDDGVFDIEVKTMAGVRHFFSWHNTIKDDPNVFDSVRQAYDYVVTTDEWKAYKEQGVEYVNGEDIDETLLVELWDVYDKTFDKLVENLPSAQKQPYEYFVQQVSLPESQVTFVRQNGRIVSALFGIDDLSVCPWLNKSFFAKINPDGKTAFIPGASTPLDMSGLGFAELTMGAMGLITQRVPSITGVATQCTNRSETYLPKLGERYTQQTTKFSFTETASYKYPVYIITS